MVVEDENENGSNLESGKMVYGEEGVTPLSTLLLLPFISSLYFRLPHSRRLILFDFFSFNL